MDYRGWAVLSAVFAGATAVLAKKGTDGISSHTALAVRVFFVFLLSIAMMLIAKQQSISHLTRSNWIFLGLSGLATFLSWFCYFRALSLGDVTRVAPIDKLSFVIAMVLGIIFLREKLDAKLVTGSVLIVAGVWVTLQ